MTQLSYIFRPRRRPKRLRDKHEKYHHSLRALAIRQKKIHIVGTPEIIIEGTPVHEWARLGFLRRLQCDSRNHSLYEPLQDLTIIKGHGGRRAAQPVLVARSSGQGAL